MGQKDAMWKHVDSLDSKSKARIQKRKPQDPQNGPWDYRNPKAAAEELIFCVWSDETEKSDH